MNGCISILMENVMDLTMQKKQAHELIDAMSNDCFVIFFALMRKIADLEKSSEATDSHIDIESVSSDISEKLKAFYEIESMRSEIAQYGPFDYESERAAALEEKFGKC